ncbi:MULTISPECIES: FecR family protein [unclassified Acinetobacter]|uniref:FecR family protein n=1 Tax=unclassified Acinetobacter TaxID=196816 RepID=UPI0013A61A2E|nr:MULTISPECIES: FecR domain-containing protein [unclassified Acinetobacter]
MKDARHIRKEIALWVIRLNCDNPTERAQVQQEFQAWQKNHPQYLPYFEEFRDFDLEMQNLSRQQNLHGETVEQTFQAIEHEQQKVISLFNQAVFSLMAISCLGYLSFTYIPFSYYFADYKTATSEVKNIVLDDGSMLTLAPKSAIKVDYTTGQRRIELIQGDIYVDVAKNPARPFIVHTKQADYQALGTRFIVNQYTDTSALNMLHSRVQARANLTAQAKPLIVSEGQRIQVDAHGLGKIEVFDTQMFKTSWQMQQIQANELALPDLLNRLNAYHSGYMIFNEKELSQIKVTGIINPQQDLLGTLQLIQLQYPQLEFFQIGNYVTYVKMKAS